MDQVKALTFDVFGTCVEWRLSVLGTIRDVLAKRALEPSWETLPEDTRSRINDFKQADWEALVQDWRDSYKVFCSSFVPGVSEWKDIDAHHRDSLAGVFEKHQFHGLYDYLHERGGLQQLSLAWHVLAPHADAAEGIRRLGTKLVTATLSNGNHGLLRDLDSHGNLSFREFLSAENFKAYKPNPEVYLGAAQKLGLKPD